MRNVFITTIAAMAFAGAATAAELGGSVGLEVTENSAGDYVAETTLGLGVSAETGVGVAFGGFAFESVDGGNLEVDEWQLGVTTTAGTFSFGDQGDLFVENDFETVGGTTLADPAEGDSLIADFGNAAVMVGFTDITADVTDVENVQGSYTASVATVNVTAVVDYNFNAEDFVLGTKATTTFNSLNVGGLLTYDNGTEAVGYEASANYRAVTAFVNGADSDAFQNVGAAVTHGFNGANLYAEGSYNVDTEEFTPAFGVAFNF